MRSYGSWCRLTRLADTTVKVPEMAESITEGTLKQWSKSLYDLPLVSGLAKPKHD